MRNVSQTAIAQRTSTLPIVGSQIDERTSNKCASGGTRTDMHIQRALGMQLQIHVAEALLEANSGCCRAR
jgi:hypothetical protein